MTAYLDTPAVPARDAEGRPHYDFQIDPSAIHAGIQRAHLERHRVVMALLHGAAHGLAEGFAWVGRLFTGHGHGHGHGHGPGALAR